MSNNIIKEKHIDLQKRKDIMLGIMDFFFNFCDEHQLKCFLTGGTLLGAVRHKGFIPWDDDVDLMMPISDFNKLIELTIQKKVYGKYFISTFHNNPGHIWTMIKVIDTTTKLIETNTVLRSLEEVQAEFYGVYIDVFPIYGLPNQKKERMNFKTDIEHTYTQYKRSVRIMTKRPKDSQLKFKLRRIAYNLYCTPFRMWGYKRFLVIMEKLINKYNLAESEYFGFSCGILKDGKDQFPTSYLKETINISFENKNYPSIAEYDGFLKHEYGDYMTLPPVEKRRYHPSEVSWR